MDDFVLVKILEGRHNLGQVVLSLHLSEALPSLNEFVEGMVRAYLQQNVHVFMILENMLKFHNVIVI